MTTPNPEQTVETDGWLVYPCQAADALAKDSPSDDRPVRLNRKAWAKIRMLVWHCDPPLCV